MKKVPVESYVKPSTGQRVRAHTRRVAGGTSSPYKKSPKEFFIAYLKGLHPNDPLPVDMVTLGAPEAGSKHLDVNQYSQVNHRLGDYFPGAKTVGEALKMVKAKKPEYKPKVEVPMTNKDVFTRVDEETGEKYKLPDTNRPKSKKGGWNSAKTRIVESDEAFYDRVNKRGFEFGESSPKSMARQRYEEIAARKEKQVAPERSPANVQKVEMTSKQLDKAGKAASKIQEKLSQMPDFETGLKKSQAAAKKIQENIKKREGKAKAAQDKMGLSGGFQNSKGTTYLDEKGAVIKRIKPPKPGKK